MPSTANEKTPRTAKTNLRYPVTQTCGDCEKPFTVWWWIADAGRNYRYGRCAECAARRWAVRLERGRG